MTFAPALRSNQVRLRASVACPSWTDRLLERSCGSTSPRFSCQSRSRAPSSCPIMIRASDPPITVLRAPPFACCVMSRLQGVAGVPSPLGTAGVAVSATPMLRRATQRTLRGRARLETSHGRQAASAGLTVERSLQVQRHATGRRGPLLGNGRDGATNTSSQAKRLLKDARDRLINDWRPRHRR